MSDTCRTYEVDGEPVVVRGSKPMSEEGIAALTEVVRAAKAKMLADPGMAERQATALERIRARNERLRDGSPVRAEGTES